MCNSHGEGSFARCLECVPYHFETDSYLIPYIRWDNGPRKIERLVKQKASVLENTMATGTAKVRFQTLKFKEGVVSFQIAARVRGRMYILWT